MALNGGGGMWLNQKGWQLKSDNYDMLFNTLHGSLLAQSLGCGTLFHYGRGSLLFSLAKSN